MKLCSKCGKEGEFRKRPDGREYAHCNECQREMGRAHYAENKKQYRDRNKRRKETVIGKVMEYLSTHPCVDCGEDDPVVLEFDHVKGEKRANIADMVKHTTWPIIFREILKCVVRCANCHRRKTFGHLRKFCARSSAE